MIKLFPFNALTQTFPFFYFKKSSSLFTKISAYVKLKVVTKAKNYCGSYFRVCNVHERKLASTGWYSIPLGASSRRPQYSFEVLKGFLCRISPLYISFSLNISYYVLDFMPYEKLPIRRPLWRLSLQTSRRILASLSWSNSLFLYSIFSTFSSPSSKDSIGAILPLLKSNKTSERGSFLLT